MINNDNIKKLQNIIFIKIFTYPLSKVYKKYSIRLQIY